MSRGRAGRRPVAYDSAWPNVPSRITQQNDGLKAPQPEDEADGWHKAGERRRPFAQLTGAVIDRGSGTPYSVGAGFTGIGPSASLREDGLSSRGLSAPMMRSVSDLQPGGAGAVSARPGPPTICTIL